MVLRDPLLGGVVGDVVMADTVGYFVRERSTKHVTDNKIKKSYKRTAREFQAFCRDVAHVNLKKMCADKSTAIKTARQYADHLAAEGESPKAVRVKLTPVCKAFEIDMAYVFSKRRKHCETETDSV